eukprot:346089-Amphidinium_carterae.1
MALKLRPANHAHANPRLGVKSQYRLLPLLVTPHKLLKHGHAVLQAVACTRLPVKPCKACPTESNDACFPSWTWYQHAHVMMYLDVPSLHYPVSESEMDQSSSLVDAQRPEENRCVVCCWPKSLRFRVYLLNLKPPAIPQGNLQILEDEHTSAPWFEVNLQKAFVGLNGWTDNSPTQRWSLADSSS